MLNSVQQPAGAQTYPSVCLCHQEMSFKCARSQFGQPYVHKFDRAGLQGLALQQKTPHSSSSVKHATAETSSHFVMAQLRNTDNGPTRHENPDPRCRSHHSSSVWQGWRGQIDHCRSAQTPTVSRGCMQLTSAPVPLIFTLHPVLQST